MEARSIVLAGFTQQMNTLKMSVKQWFNGYVGNDYLNSSYASGSNFPYMEQEIVIKTDPNKTLFYPPRHHISGKYRASHQNKKKANHLYIKRLAFSKVLGAGTKS